MCRLVDVLRAELFDETNASLDAKRPHMSAVIAIPLIDTRAKDIMVSDVRLLCCRELRAEREMM
jgi:hypothetical protein